MAWLAGCRCAQAEQSEDFHCTTAYRKRFGEGCNPAFCVEWREHYLFLHAAAADCLECVQFWVVRGASLTKGTINHDAWNALAWARHASADKVIAYLEEVEAMKSSEMLKDNESYGNESETTVAMSSALPDCLFSIAHDYYVWNAAMHGNVETLQGIDTKSLCWSLRPDFVVDLPSCVRGWTLREFVKLKRSLMSETVDEFQAVLTWIADAERKAIMEIVEKMSKVDSFSKKRSSEMLGMLWSGHVVSHGTKKNELQAQELWRTALSSCVTAEEFRQMLRKRSFQRCVFDTTNDCRIGHLASTRSWTLRMHCVAAFHCSNETHYLDRSRILSMIENRMIEQSADKLKQKLIYTVAERRILLHLVDLSEAESKFEPRE